MADTNLLVLAKEFSKLRSDVKEILKMPVGPQGERGEKGERGEPGKPGKDGRDGINGRDGVGVPGRDGRDGIDGVDGKDGKDGVSVTNAYVDFDGSLVIELSDGNQIDAGFVSIEAKDSIVQMLKNGALSLNELLPPQEGNVGKVLATDGTNAYWTTVSSGGGAVDSVNGQTGVVVLDAADVGAATTAQGALAESALQPSAIGTSVQAYDADLTAWAGISTSAKQDTLVSGTNIKSVNSTSLLGSGDLALFAGGLIQVKVVATLPGTPDANTLYIVTT